MHRKTLRDFMVPAHRQALAGLPTTHENCRSKTGVCRPGKTARDRAKR
jgi:hypothetical protein